MEKGKIEYRNVFLVGLVLGLVLGLLGVSGGILNVLFFYIFVGILIKYVVGMLSFVLFFIVLVGIFEYWCLGYV